MLFWANLYFGLISLIFWPLTYSPSNVKVYILYICTRIRRKNTTIHVDIVGVEYTLSILGLFLL